MKQLFRSLLLLAVLSTSYFSANASHVAGGYIQMECTGTPGQYLVRMVLYRDCSGIGAPGSVTLDFDNDCGGVADETFYLSEVSSQEVSQICPQQMNNTECNGGSLPGYEEYIYEATINLADCDTWTASYRLCCRNSTNNLTGQPYFNVTSQFNTQTDDCNETPTVTAQPEPFVCVNQPVSYNLGAFEGDGDSIAYALVPASDNPGSNVNYGGGFSGTSPIAGVTIDPVTGTVTYTPTVTGPYVFVIQMTEYDSNGDVISVTNYEYQTYVENCNNTPPQPPSATPGGGITNVTGSIVQNGPSSLTMCQGNQGCFDVVFTDPDAGDILTVQSNLASVLPGATINQTGTNPLTVSVCWQPTSTQGTVTLNFLVEDDACPLVGQNNYAASINVTNPGVANVVTVDETCGGTDQGSATISVVGNPGPFTFEIDNQSSATNLSNGTGQFSNLDPGTYDYNVTTPGGCELQGTFTINPGPPLPINMASADVSCNGGNDGTATVTPNGGTAPYNYVWSQGGTGIGQTTQTASGLTAGTYEVTLTDANGCQATDQVVVAEPAVLAGNLTPTDVLCLGDCNGEIDVTGVAGGNGGYQYSVDGGAFQAGTNFTGLCTGPHQVVIEDSEGCTLTLNTNIGEPAELVLTIDQVNDASCGTPSGSAVVSAAGGTTDYTFTIGGNNQTGAGPFTFNGLAPTGHTVTVTDANGCTDQINITVGAVAAPTAFVDNLEDVGCLGGNDGEVIIGTTGTIAPVTYSLNGGAPQASNTFTGLTAGNYTVDVEDGNGCTATTNFTITQPAVLSFSTTTTDASCFDVCDAEIDVNASGGTSPYEYSSDGGITFQSSNVLTGLCEDNNPILVVVRDDNGCITNNNVNVNEPPQLTANTVPTDPVCEGGCDGEIQVNANGGTGAYQYSIDNGALQGPNTFNGLCADAYDIMVEDANGCQFTTTETLNDPPPLTIDTISTSPSNCGFNDGEIVLTAAGVNPPFQYSINNGAFQANGTFSNLFAGAYESVVMDDLGCTDTAFFGVNDIQMDGELIDTTSVTCFGGSDGDVEVINTDGVAPITFELDNSGVTQGNGFFSGLDAGSHIVTIYDAGFCIYTIPFTLVEPDEVEFDTDITDIACNGGATGEIEFINVTGGNGNYQYSIDGGFTFQASPTFTGLTQGNYNLVVIDGNNCSNSDVATINQATPITIDTAVVDLLCNGDGTGEIQVIANGGAGNYQYSIDNGGTFTAVQFFVGLQAGTYDIVVEDGAGCQMTNQAIVSEPTPLASNYNPLDATCFDVCDGEIEFVANGGTAPYLYSVDNGTTFGSNNTVTGLCDDTYDVIVQDDNDCQITSTVTINEPTEVTFTSTETPSTCGNPNGEITINANGGTPGYNYSSDNGSSFVGVNSFTGLAAGTYDLVVEDANGCPASGQQIVTNEASPVINFVNTQDPSCTGVADGEAVVDVSGGTGTILYSIDGGPTQTGNTITGIGAGPHTIEVIDDNGCTDTENITITDPPALTFVDNVTNLTCFQNSTGAINIVPSGGTPPYQYSFDNGTTFGASPNNNFIAAGTYDVIVEDDNGCTETAQVDVTEPPLLEIDNITTVDATCHSFCDGSITLGVIGGTGAYSYTWTQGSAGNVNTANGLCAGIYDFTVEDDNGCTAFDNAEIFEPAEVTFTSIVETNVTCNGDCDGEIEITSPTAAQYSVDGGVTYQASNVFTGLCDGSYQLEIQDAAGCLADSTAEIWQPDALTASAGPDITLCYGVDSTLEALGTGGIQPFTFLWSNGPTTFENPITHTDTTTYSVVITDQNGCTASAQSTVNVRGQVEVVAFNDTTICPGGTASLFSQASEGLAPYTYEWSNNQNGQNINVSPAAATTYTVSATDGCDHTVTADVQVDIHTLPQVDLVGDQLQGCSPLDVQFTNQTPAGQVGANCTWSMDGSVYQGCNGPNHTFDAPGCYDVRLQVASPAGCVNDITLDDYICVYDNPDANFYYDPAKPTITDNVVNFFNTSTGAETYSWNFQQYGSSTDVNPTADFLGAEPEDEILVCLEAYSVHGCEDEICKPVIIYDDFVIFVPNAFTPDFDEFNQTFLPIMPPTADILEYELMIFNRWGEPIFESHDPSVGWDGTYRGEMAKDEVYVWQIILIEGTEETKRTYRGHVTLLK